MLATCRSIICDTTKNVYKNEKPLGTYRREGRGAWELLVEQYMCRGGEGSLGASGEAAHVQGRGGESGSFWRSSMYRGKGRGV